jgi:phage repressor protein C with HTH and peptisase S24 domain
MRGTEKPDSSADVRTAFAERLRRVLFARQTLEMDEVRDGMTIELDATKLAGLLGVSRSSLYKWLGAKFEPGLAKLATLAQATNVSLDWLITGRGEVRPNALPGYLQPAFDAGSAPVAFERKWFELNFGSEDQLPPILVEVRDDSMEPTFRKGDLLLGDRVSVHRENGIYLCARTRALPDETILSLSGGEPRPAEDGESIRGKFVLDKNIELIRRLFPRRVEWKGSTAAIVKCDNPAYPTVIEWTPDDDQGVEIVAYVVWHARKL